MSPIGDGRTPIILLTGFLGSGKTTLLNGLLHHPALARTAVIVNEFGEIGIDHLLVARSSEQVIELSNGCLCCAVRSDLVTTLFGLHAGRIRGEVSPFDRVIIETTGLADPAPVLRTLYTDEAVARRFRVASVITVVDAVNGPATLERHPEALRQAAAANAILLSKTDLCDALKTEKLEEHLTSLNPWAVIRPVLHGDIDPSVIFDVDETMPEGQAEARDALLAGGSGGHGGHSHAGGECGHIRTLVHTLDQPVRWSDFVSWVNRLSSLAGSGLLRVKGLVNIEERPGEPLSVNSAQEVFHPPVFLDRWPSDDRRTRLVFILHEMEPAAIELTFPMLAGTISASKAE